MPSPTDDGRIKCVTIGSAPTPAPGTRRPTGPGWLVVLEYGNNFDVESAHDSRDDALKRAKELAAEHNVSLVERP